MARWSLVDWLADPLGSAASSSKAGSSGSGRVAGKSVVGAGAGDSNEDGIEDKILGKTEDSQACRCEHGSLSV